MYAAQGDRLIVQSAHTDRAPRDGEILEVHGQNGSPPYLVLWSDTGHESLVFPGPDAFVEHYVRESPLDDPPRHTAAAP